VEALVIYPAAIAAIGVVAGEYVGRLAGMPASATRGLALAIVAAVTAINLTGVSAGRWVQNVVTAAKVAALGGVAVVALLAGSGAGWHGELPGAPTGAALWVALGLAFQAVIWTYYGYPDAAKIAEEVVDPSRTLPRVLLFGLATAAALYLLLNAAFLNVLPLDRIAASNLVAEDVAAVIVGARGGTVVAVLALLVVLASLNGNVFVTPRVVFGLAREGLGPAPLTRVNQGGTPGPAMLLVGAVALLLAGSGTFEALLGLAIGLILVIDSCTVIALFRLRARSPAAPFRVPLYPVLPAFFVAVYGALLVAAGFGDPLLVARTAGVLGVVTLLSWVGGLAPACRSRPSRAEVVG
jgi:APA family basic amino acid/polyamine antiporter